MLGNVLYLKASDPDAEINIFKLDHAGKTVEHWDGLQVLSDKLANANSIF